MVESVVLGSRNRVEHVTLSSGASYVISRWGELSPDPERRFRRVLQAHDGRFDNCVHFRTPLLYAVDEETRTTAHEYVHRQPRVSSLSEACAAFAELHAQPVTPTLDHSLHAMPQIALWEGLAMSEWQSLSMGELETWRLIQSQDLREALVEVLTPAPIVLVHGDASQRNLLVDDTGTVTIVDWEEFRAGDGARDIGFLFGETLESELRRNLHHVRTARGNITLTNAADSAVAAAKSIWAQGLTSYCAIRAPMDNGFVSRSVRYAGWRLAESALAEGATRLRLTADSKAVLGLGLKLLRHPELAGTEFMKMGSLGL
nr:MULTISPECIES: phosphotransferase [unclassified Leucobacter]